MNTPKNPLSRAYEEKLSRMSPFEIKNELIRLAQKDARESSATYLNAGRGNPNWTSSDAREAFFMLGNFAVAECKRDYSDTPGIAGCPEHDGIAKRFHDYLESQPDSDGKDQLKRG